MREKIREKTFRKARRAVMGILCLCLAACAWPRFGHAADDAMIRAAETHIAAGAFDKAETALKDFVGRNPEDAEAWNLLGNVVFKLGRIDDAHAHYRKALDLDPADPRVFNNLGALRLAKGDTAEALTYFLTAARLDPKFAEALYNAGMLLQSGGHLDKAVAHYSQALQAAPDHVMARYKRAAALWGLDNIAAAVADYEAVVRLDPMLVGARADLAFALLQQGRNQEAIPHFEAALAQTPGLARGHYGLGLARRALGEYESALASFRKAVELDGARTDYRVEMAFAIMVLNRENARAECERELLRAVQADPDNARAVFLTGVFFDDTDRPERAVEYYRKALGLGYEPLKSKLYLAENLIKTGEKKEAETLLREVLEAERAGSPVHRRADELLQLLNG